MKFNLVIHSSTLLLLTKSIILQNTSKSYCLKTKRRLYNEAININLHILKIVSTRKTFLEEIMKSMYKFVFVFISTLVITTVIQNASGAGLFEEETTTTTTTTTKSSANSLNLSCLTILSTILIIIGMMNTHILKY
ncbi:unnamed protein product [Heterobilharzia americana]|nr:unnamed protein product [Heterobilharzia americana]